MVRSYTDVLSFLSLSAVINDCFAECISRHQDSPGENHCISLMAFYTYLLSYEFNLPGVSMHLPLPLAFHI
jgi:hypothetical protein